MNNIKEAIETYQCPGCVNGSDINCEKYELTNSGCNNHCAGTITSFGKVFLGLFKGFNRLGIFPEMKLSIFETLEQQKGICRYDWLNIPVWKYQNEKGHIFIRGFSPRINKPFLHIILNGDFTYIKCFEITDKLLETIG